MGIPLLLINYASISPRLPFPSSFLNESYLELEI